MRNVVLDFSADCSNLLRQATHGVLPYARGRRYTLDLDVDEDRAFAEECVKAGKALATEGEPADVAALNALQPAPPVVVVPVEEPAAAPEPAVVVAPVTTEAPSPTKPVPPGPPDPPDPKAAASRVG
jgi:hypothetical protein